jgi:hypothetical protein
LKLVVKVCIFVVDTFCSELIKLYISALDKKFDQNGCITDCGTQLECNCTTPFVVKPPELEFAALLAKKVTSSQREMLQFFFLLKGVVE